MQEPITRLPRRFLARSLSLSELIEIGLPQPSEEAEAKAKLDLKRFFADANRPVFERFLNRRGYTEDQIIAALALRVINNQTIDFTWCRLLAKLLSSTNLRNSDTRIQGAGGINAPLYPFLCWADHEIADWSHRFPGHWHILRPLLIEQLAVELSQHTIKTCVLEAEILHLAHETSAAKGAETTELFACEVQSNPRFVQRFWLRYPALSRLIACTILQWQENLQCLLHRLSVDAETIRKTFSIASPNNLEKIESTHSDPHNGGQRVFILHFSGDQKLVYKPRSVESDLAFQRCIDWLNETGFTPPLAALKIVAGSGYGWVEHVPAKPLPSRTSASSFYERLGGQLALLHVLQGTDFHYENIIACADQPVLVDLETLLHGPPRKATDSEMLTPVERLLSRSVFGSGLLPGWGERDLMSPSPDLSGIGAGNGQLYRSKGDVLEKREDGSLRIQRRELPIPVHPNQPSFQESRINPASFSSAIIDGFTRAYDLLAADPSAFASAAGPQQLLDAEVRHVPIGTVVYASLIRRSTHPDFLSRMVHRELIFAVLAFRHDAEPTAGLINSEISALLRGDVPRFVSHPNSYSLFDSEGHEINDFLELTARQSMKQRLKDLTPSDRRFQQNVIRLSMATLVRAGDPAAEPAPLWKVDPADRATGLILEEVDQIAAALCRDAIDVDGSIGWIGLVDGHHGSTQLDVVGHDLYHGAAGIGLFLAAAGKRLGNTRYEEMALCCARCSLAFVEGKRGSYGGGYSGRASAAYALLHFAQHFKESLWRDVAIDKLIEFASASQDDPYLDLIAGSAGLCAVLVTAWAMSRDPRLPEATFQTADHLLSRRVVCRSGHGWPSRNARAPLTGFAHGAAGIGWALLRAGAALGRDDLVDAGRGAFAYERSTYSREHQGWPDLRRLEDSTEEFQDRYSYAWCHGGPGIGLSRATLPEELLQDEDRKDVRRAVQPLRVPSLAPSDCLCHGELGNIELLLLATKVCEEPGLTELARQRAISAIRRKRAVGEWRCGGIPRAPIPGLMTGLAGIGFGLLRTEAPESLPSLLTLAPPAGE